MKMSMSPEIIAVIVAALVVTWLISARLNQMAKQIASISRIESKLDLVLKQAGIEYDPYKNVSPKVIDLVKAGKKIEAIKTCRAETGVGLKEAKEYVEELQRKSGFG